MKALNILSLFILQKLRDELERKAVSSKLAVAGYSSLGKVRRLSFNTLYTLNYWIKLTFSANAFQG